VSKKENATLRSGIYLTLTLGILPILMSILTLLYILWSMISYKSGSSRRCARYKNYM